MINPQAQICICVIAILVIVMIVQFLPNGVSMARKPSRKWRVVSEKPAKKQRFENKDYKSQLADSVMDDRARSNHDKWVSEVGTHSATNRGFDNLDEALEASTPFHGLRRPQPVAQNSNLHQHTEVDGSILAKNRKFNFRA